MGRRALLAALLASAWLLDAASVHRIAFWALVAAIPVAAAAALESFGDYLDRGEVVDGLQALLWAPALALLLAAAAARGPMLAAGSVPRLGVTALAGCAAVLALKVLVFAVELARTRLARRLAPA